MDLLEFMMELDIYSDVSRQNLGIAILEKRLGIWGVLSPGQSPGDSSAVFLIQNTSFSLNLIISMTLVIQ